MISVTGRHSGLKKNKRSLFVLTLTRQYFTVISKIKYHFGKGVVAKQEKVETHGKVKLWFVRHGQASFGSDDYDRLSPLGARQSRILGQYLKKTGVCFDAVYSGDMKRQKDTAKLVTAQLDNLPAASEASEFNEYDFLSIIHAQLPGLKNELGLSPDILSQVRTDRKKFQKLFSMIVNRWVSGTHDAETVETYKEYTARVRKGLGRVIENSRPGQGIGIFTSAGVINVVMQMALGLSNPRATELGWRIRNTSVSLFGCSVGNPMRGTTDFRFDLMGFNSTAHLDLTGNRELITYR